MSELYGQLRGRLAASVAPEDRRYSIAVFEELLRLWIERPWLGLAMAPDPDESYEELQRLLFEWSTPHEDDAVTGLVDGALNWDDSLRHEVYELRRDLELRLRHAIELRTITG